MPSDAVFMGKPYVPEVLAKVLDDIRQQLVCDDRAGNGGGSLQGASPHSRQTRRSLCRRPRFARLGRVWHGLISSLVVGVATGRISTPLAVRRSPRSRGAASTGNAR